jgi:hypothetical protein
MVILGSLSFACFLLMDDCTVRHSDSRLGETENFGGTLLRDLTAAAGY